MATFRVVDEDGDYYETDGDPLERLKQLEAERDEWHRQNGLLRGELNAVRSELEQLRARVGESRQQRSTTMWAVAWDRGGKTTYSFPIENEKYARDGFADLVRSGVTGMRLVRSEDGVRWRDAARAADAT